MTANVLLIFYTEIPEYRNIFVSIRSGCCALSLALSYQYIWFDCSCTSFGSWLLSMRYVLSVFQWPAWKSIHNLDKIRIKVWILRRISIKIDTKWQVRIAKGHTCKSLNHLQWESYFVYLETMSFICQMSNCTSCHCKYQFFNCQPISTQTGTTHLHSVICYSHKQLS